jgi:hypothetical protein
VQPFVGALDLDDIERHRLHGQELARGRRRCVGEWVDGGGEGEGAGELCVPLIPSAAAEAEVWMRARTVANMGVCDSERF